MTVLFATMMGMWVAVWGAWGAVNSDNTGESLKEAGGGLLTNGLEVTNSVLRNG